MASSNSPTDKPNDAAADDTKLPQHNQDAYAGLVATAMDAIIVVDSQQRITVFNAAAEKMFLYTAAKAIGQPLSTLIPQRFRQVHGAHIQGFGKAGVTSRAMGHLKPLSAVRATGEEFPIEASISHLRSNGEEFFTAIMRDITERVAAEKATQRLASELKSANETLREQIHQRHAAEAAVLEANQELKIRANEMERNASEMRLLAEMGEFLQACVNSEESRQVVERWVPRLLHLSSGVIYLNREFGGMVEAFARWNSSKLPVKDAFEPRDCWGLRRGRSHVSSAANGATKCAHSPDLKDGMSICVPMMAQGQSIGVLHALWPEIDSAGDEWARSREALATAAADTLSLAIANVKLRETLKEQAIRDPLTQLYNRRYLEDSLSREISRARRAGTSIGIIMLDVDNFKRFNDSFGHPAGDELLRALGKFLKAHIRPEDIPARYGGEEFTLILPGASCEIVRARAEMLRSRFHEILTDRGAGLEKTSRSISLSFGVAVFPEHGGSVEAIIKAADEALYEAKRSGKDCVMISAHKTQITAQPQPQAV